MTAPARRIPWTRLAAEFVVIVVGVLVALAADDWRQLARDRALERESLRQVVRDLEIDQEDIAPMADAVMAWDEALRFLNDFVARGGQGVDGLLAVVDSANRISVPSYESSGFAYNGLMATGRIDLITDDSLKASLVRYHEDRQKALAYINAQWLDAANNWFRVIGPYMVFSESGDDDVFYPPLRALRRTGDLVEDGDLHWLTAEFLGWNRDLARYVDELLGLNESLTVQIESYLQPR